MVISLVPDDAEPTPKVWRTIAVRSNDGAKKRPNYFG